MIHHSAPVPYYQFDNLQKFSDRVIHFVTTRNSLGSNNFTIAINDHYPTAEVVANRMALANQFGFEVESLVLTEQVHGSCIAQVSPAERGRGALDRQTELPSCDGTITHHPDICLVAKAADCVPLLMYDPDNNVVASIHAGWRGTIAHIAEKAVVAFVSLYGSKPANLVAGIGPSIGPCCLEVGDEVVAMVQEAFGTTKGLILKSDKYTNPVFDIWEANLSQLTKAGLQPQNIEVARICSRCNNKTFFSARCGDEGRFGAFIMLR